MAELTTQERSFYLKQAPPDVWESLLHLHRRADQSVALKDQLHTDRVLTYLAEVMRLASELRVIVEMAGLDEQDDEEEGEFGRQHAATTTEEK